MCLVLVKRSTLTVSESHVFHFSTEGLHRGSQTTGALTVTWPILGLWLPVILILCMRSPSNWGYKDTGLSFSPGSDFWTSSAIPRAAGLLLWWLELDIPRAADLLPWWLEPHTVMQPSRISQTNSSITLEYKAPIVHFLHHHNSVLCWCDLIENRSCLLDAWGVPAAGCRPLYMLVYNFITILQAREGESFSSLNICVLWSLALWGGIFWFFRDRSAVFATGIILLATTWRLPLLVGGTQPRSWTAGFNLKHTYSL